MPGADRGRPVGHRDLRGQRDGGRGPRGDGGLDAGRALLAIRAAVPRIDARRRASTPWSRAISARPPGPSPTTRARCSDPTCGWLAGDSAIAAARRSRISTSAGTGPSPAADADGIVRRDPAVGQMTHTGEVGHRRRVLTPVAGSERASIRNQGQIRENPRQTDDGGGPLARPGRRLPAAPAASSRRAAGLSRARVRRPKCVGPHDGRS